MAATAWAEIVGHPLGLSLTGITTVVSDSFNRADGAIGTADTGQSWTANSGTWTVASNKAHTAGGTQITVVVDAGIADCTVQGTLVTAGDSGLCWRSSDDNNNFITNATAAFKRVAGSFTQVGSSGGSTAANDVIKIVLSGNSHTLTKNGAAWISYSEAFNNTATKHGLRANTVTNYDYDNFTVTNP